MTTEKSIYQIRARHEDGTQVGTATAERRDEAVEKVAGWVAVLTSKRSLSQQQSDHRKKAEHAVGLAERLSTHTLLAGLGFIVVEFGPPVELAKAARTAGASSSRTDRDKEPIDTSRPAFAVVGYEGTAGPGRSHGVGFSGFWQRDGSWADADNGPGGVGLAEHITETLRDFASFEGKNAPVAHVTIQTFGGRRSDSAEICREFVLNGGDVTVKLPIDPDFPAGRFTGEAPYDRDAEELVAAISSTLATMPVGILAQFIAPVARRNYRDLSERREAQRGEPSVVEDLWLLLDALSQVRGDELRHAIEQATEKAEEPGD